MQRLLLLLPVILITIGVISVMTRGQKSTDPDQEQLGYGVLVLLLVIGAIVAIATFWFFQAELHFES